MFWYFSMRSRLQQDALHSIAASTSRPAPCSPENTSCQDLLSFLDIPNVPSRHSGTIANLPSNLSSVQFPATAPTCCILSALFIGYSSERRKQCILLLLYAQNYHLHVEALVSCYHVIGTLPRLMVRFTYVSWGRLNIPAVALLL